MNPPKKKIGLFGGTFDPPHLGHLYLLTHVIATEEIDAIWLLPTFSHPFSKKSVSFDHRVKMCRILSGFFRFQIKVSRIEQKMEIPNYTINTLRFLINKYPDHSFRLIIGSDILLEKKSWRAFDEIERLVPLIVVPRKSYEEMDFSIPNISSTVIKKHFADRKFISKIVPMEILRYIDKYELYKNPE